MLDNKPLTTEEMREASEFFFESFEIIQSKMPENSSSMPRTTAGRCGGSIMTPSLWITKPRSVIHKTLCRSPVILKTPQPDVHRAPPREIL
jgi:hypothetical protein